MEMQTIDDSRELHPQVSQKRFHAAEVDAEVALPDPELGLHPHLRLARGILENFDLLIEESGRQDAEER